MASTDALPIPRKNTAYRVTFPLKDSSGAPVTSASGLDSEYWNGTAWADCAAEATSMGQGMYYLDLSATEMNFDTVSIVVKSSNALQQDIVLYPEETGDIRVNVTAVLSSAIASIDEFKADVSGIPAAVWANGTRTLSSFGTLVSDIVTGVWDRATSLLTTPGSVGKFLVDNVAAILAKTNLIGTSGASLPPPPSAEEITLYLGTVYEHDDGTALEISSDSSVNYTGATAKVEFGGHELNVVVSGASGAWVFGIEMSEADQASLVAGEYSYTLVPRLSGKSYDSPPISAGKLVLVGDH